MTVQIGGRGPKYVGLFETGGSRGTERLRRRKELELKIAKVELAQKVIQALVWALVSIALLMFLAGCAHSSDAQFEDPVPVSVEQLRDSAVHNMIRDLPDETESVSAELMKTLEARAERMFPEGFDYFLWCPEENEAVSRGMIRIGRITMRDGIFSRPIYRRPKE